MSRAPGRALLCLTLSVAACGGADLPDTELAAGAAVGDPEPAPAAPAPEEAPVVAEASGIVLSAASCAPSAPITYCPGTDPNRPVAKCTLAATTYVNTLDGSYAVSCSANLEVEQHCGTTPRLKKCTPTGNPAHPGSYVNRTGGTAAYTGALGAPGATAEFFATGEVWKYSPHAGTNYRGPSDDTLVMCVVANPVTLRASGYLDTCKFRVPIGTSKTFPGPSVIDNPGTAELEVQAQVPCRTDSVVSLHDNRGLRACSVVHTNTAVATERFGSVQCKADAALSLHADGFLDSCTLAADAAVNSPTVSGTSRALTCAAGTVLNLADTGQVEACTTKGAPVTLATQRSGNVVCRAGSALTFTAAGHVTGSCTIDSDTALLRLPYGVGAVGAAITCKAATGITLTSDGFVSKCTPTAATSVDTFLGNTVACKAASTVTLHASGTSRGYLSGCTLTSAAALARRVGAPVACAADAPASFHTDGYLASCRLGAVTGATTPAASGGVAVRCQSGTTLGYTSAGALAACTLADVESLTSERFGSLGCATGSALVFSTAGYPTGTCALTAHSAVSWPPQGTAAAASVTCASGTPLTLTADGYASECTSPGVVSIRTLKSSTLVSCSAQSPVVVGASGASRGYLKSCLLGANYAGVVAKIGEVANDSGLTCAADTPMGLADDGYLAQCTPTLATATAYSTIRVYDDPATSAYQAVPCAVGEELRLTSAHRLESCTLRAAYTTGRYAGAPSRICPAGQWAELDTISAAGDVYEVMARLDGVPLTTACKLEPAEACTSGAQCASGTCTSGSCTKLARDGACSTAAQCLSGSCLGTSLCN